MPVLQQTAEIMDEAAVRRALTRIAFEIIEKNHGSRSLLLAGIQTRGVPLAERIADKLGEVEGFRPPVLPLDIGPFRDDLPHTAPPVLPDIPGLAGCTVVIVDDVLYTGRSVRAAIEAVSHMGRAVTENFPSVRITSVKTCRPPRTSAYASACARPTGKTG